MRLQDRGPCPGRPPTLGESVAASDPGHARGAWPSRALKDGALAVDARGVDRAADSEREDGAPGGDRPDLDSADGGGRDRRAGDRRAGDRRERDRRDVDARDGQALDRERRLSSALAQGARALLRWTVAVAVLLLVGGVAVWQGWTLLVDGSPGESGRPATSCVDRAAADAEDFAAVLGDERDVDRAALERACADGP